MKVYNSIGSKERFLEMFKGINKIQLNEDVINSNQIGYRLLENEFNKLKSGNARIKQKNTQVDGKNNYVEVIIGDDNSDVIFRFKINSTEGEQDDTYDVNNANLVEFDFNSSSQNIELDETSKEIQNFNSSHKHEIMDIVTEYGDFESDDIGVDDELYEEAIKLIDKVPYKNGTETMQTNKAYVDQKPTNSKLRVNADELNKFAVSESEDEYIRDDYTEPNNDEDMFALPPDYNPADLPKATTDDNSKGIDPYNQLHSGEEEDADAEEQTLFSQAYDNLLSRGMSMPTRFYIEKEMEKIKNGDKPVEKTRAFSKERPEWALEEDVHTQIMAGNTYDTLSPELKRKLIINADKILFNELGQRYLEMPNNEHNRLIKDKAIELYSDYVGNTYNLGRFSTGLNEDNEKSYPKGIGGEFKPEPQIHDKKKKSKSVVKLKEDDEMDFDVDNVIVDKEKRGNIISGGKADDNILNFNMDYFL
jgi:hypothetical protein